MSAPAQILNAMATRGDRVVLTRARFSRSDRESEEFGIDLLHVIEIDADERIAATVTFDPDDIDAAFEELDARYLAGEAAPYSEAWSVVKESFDAYNRRERPPTMHDFTNADNRRGTAFQSGDMIAFMGATWADTPDVKLRIESVHRLRAGGAVVTWTGHGNSVEGFEAEWRAITLSRCTAG